MEISVKSKYLRVSPRKLRPVVNLLRGKNLLQAKDLLSLIPNKGARMTESLINSAVAIIKEVNAEPSKFFVSRIYCSDGPRLKRGKPASKGVVMAISKRQSHLYLTVADNKLSADKENTNKTNEISKTENKES